MTTARQDAAQGTASAPSAAPDPSDVTPGVTSDVPSAATAPEAPAGTPPVDPSPITSLSALLGGGFEGGAACAADGTCD